MPGETSGDRDSALRALRSAKEEVAVLRRETLPSEDGRGRLLRVANVVDRALRRLLRDDEGADLDVRLRALAPDEIRTDEILAELRRNDRLPLATAAAVHELLEIRRRLERGGVPEEEDRVRALDAFSRLERDLERDAVAPVASTAPAAPSGEADPIWISDIPSRRGARRRGIDPRWLAAGLVLVLLALAGVWSSRRGPDQMSQGIALFRSGEYAESAQHFWRYAEANPRDATPHLYLARIHRRMNRPELAVEAIRQAQRLAPEDAAVHRELGFLLLDTGQSTAATERFRHAVELDSTSSEGYVGLVRALREAGREEEAEQVIGTAPAEVRALLTRPPPS